MRYPEILEHSIEKRQKSSVVKLKLLFDEKLIFFKGHFTDNPILPGIAQTDFVIEFSSCFLMLDKKQVRHIPQLKFSQVILPNKVLNLQIELSEHQLQFEYTDDDQNRYSSGKIQL
ncbi:hydroxymyristoyl-ACP dehydratase [Fastidiosibacter lacustris]|uniref:ApeI family dehydratase n=1 Tax=Fastidiosibacter lacustris TaxID=2056695 RepID=UPI000E34C3A2|nr:hydroxymyristoyl-ACP dehydratase [Fastidiosibacter lacustris]